MQDHFFITVDSFHTAGKCAQENIFNLNATDLQSREVVEINFTDNFDTCFKEDNRSFFWPTQELPPADWKDSVEEGKVTVVYKLVRCYFMWLGLQDRIEKLIVNEKQKNFINFHRKMFCWMDRWNGLTIPDIRE